MSQGCFGPAFRSSNHVSTQYLLTNESIFVMCRSDTVPFAKSFKYLKGYVWQVLDWSTVFFDNNLHVWKGIQIISSNGWKPGQGWSLASLLIAGMEASHWTKSSEICKLPFLNLGTEKLSQPSLYPPNFDALGPVGLVANILKVAKIHHDSKLNVHRIYLLFYFLASSFKELSDPNLGTPELGHFLSGRVLFKTSCEIL